MRRKNLIIAIAAVVLLSAGIAALTLWPQGEPESNQQDIPPPEEIVRADLVNIALDEVASVIFTPRYGAHYSLLKETTDNGSFELKLDADDPVFPGERSRLNAVFLGAISLTNVAVIAENATDDELNMFGLNDPVLTWEINRTDGSSERFMLGAEQVVGTGRFARSEGSREIVILTERQSSLLLITLEDMYDLTFIPHSILERAESIMDIFDHILIEREDTVLEFYRRTDEEVFLTLGAARYQMLQPIVGDASDHMVQTSLLEDFIQIMPSSVEAKRPTDLSIFGLDTPSRLTLSSESWERTLLIGNRNADGTGTYVMIEGYDAVLLDRAGEYLFLNIQPAILRARLLWLHNIVDVGFVTFELEDETRVLRLEHDRENDSLTGFLDDVEISETNARRLYISALSIMQSGITQEQVPLGASPNYTVTLHMLDGSSETMELYALYHSQFLIVKNGENTGFFITRMALQNALLDRFAIVDRGDELPMT
ncbi:MAG: DUF4340 domain-containing protein [Oscillospiraceae bacterium]|nr:DUF4340 domain-containing protein [Oscillospiraceae bacterium]MCL2277827.1 DUF4340 domain-containing protein [Oscillospiraceae bacterium]